MYTKAKRIINMQPDNNLYQQPNNSPELQKDPSQPFVQSPPPKPVKSNKKRNLYVVIVLLVLVILGASLWYFVFNKQEPVQPNVSSGDSNSFLPSDFIQAGNEVSYINEAGQIEKLADVEDGDEVVQVLNSDDQPEARYITTEEFDGMPKVSSYGSLTKEGKKEKFKFIDGVDGYYSSFRLSPNGKNLVVERSNENGFMSSIDLINADTGEAKTVFKPQDPSKDGLITFVDWKDDNTVLLQTQSCRQCDGPPLPELVSLDTSSGELSSFYSGNKEDMSYAKFLPQGDSIYVYGGDFSRVFGGGSEYKDDFVYKIDKSTGEAKLIKRMSDIDEKTLIRPVGVNKGVLYLSYATDVKTEDENALYSDESGSYNPVPKLNALEDNGNIREIPIDSKYLKEKISIQQAVPYNGGLLMVLFDLTYSDTGDGSSNSSYNLLRLESLEEVSGVVDMLNKTINSNSQFKIITK